MLTFALYTGDLDDINGKGHASNVVMHLADKKLVVAHSISLDNLYNSYDLTCKLLSQNTFSTKTLRIDHKHNPIEVTSKKLEKAQELPQPSPDKRGGLGNGLATYSCLKTDYVRNLQTSLRLNGHTGDNGKDKWITSLQPVIAVKETYEQLKKNANAVGLNISTQKTKLLIQSQQNYNIESATIDNTDTVTQFVHLGAELPQHGTEDGDI
ncbi:hypothetical protein ILUMI_20141 [Ignelater luminosus]|uniref:PiggyBac transposable element-derived protein domain-containing protein n=1 Tax=Ignelater luminosus TaxID=2038154 RepID=A0A8K0G2J8_IGNLU|nr:hypothetical protein ILUMI_20141 [Ignelater luminosus]